MIKSNTIEIEPPSMSDLGFIEGNEGLYEDYLKACFMMLNCLCSGIGLQDYGVNVIGYGSIIHGKINYLDKEYSLLIQYKHWDSGFLFNRYDTKEYLDKLYYDIKSKLLMATDD